MSRFLLLFGCSMVGYFWLLFFKLLAFLLWVLQGVTVQGVNQHYCAEVEVFFSVSLLAKGNFLMRVLFKVEVLISWDGNLGTMMFLCSSFKLCLRLNTMFRCVLGMRDILESMTNSCSHGIYILFYIIYNVIKSLLWAVTDQKY